MAFTLIEKASRKLFHEKASRLEMLFEWFEKGIHALPPGYLEKAFLKYDLMRLMNFVSS